MEPFEVFPADVVIFLDDRLPHDSPLDVNVVAIVIDERGALYVDRRRFFLAVRWIPLADLSSLRNVRFRRVEIDDGLREQIAQYFLAAKSRYPLFEAGLSYLYRKNYSLFRSGQLFPRRPVYLSDEEYEAAWNELVGRLQPLDGIFTVHLRHPVSRFIAWFTHGPWSHVAMYTGDGRISESVTTGVRDAPLEIYKGRQFWVGAYRHQIVQEGKKIEIPTAAWLKDRFREGYNYKAAVRYGMKAFGNDHSHELVPNSMIYGGGWEFLGHA